MLPRPCSRSLSRLLTHEGEHNHTHGGGAAKAIGTVISNFSSDASSNNSSAICKSILATSLVKH